MEATMKTTAQIFLIDDHPMVREGLKSVLEMNDFMVCGEAGDGREALEKIGTSGATLALVDIRLPDIDGIDLASTLRERYPDLKVAILTSFSDESMVLRAARAGVHGYMLKEIAPEKLRESIISMMEGRIAMDEKASDILLRGLANETDDREARNRWTLLSPQELKVAELVTRGLINKEIGDQMNLSEKTVKNYLASIFTKLNVSRRAQVAAFYTKYVQS
jgi:two-component system response regulator DevR